MPPSSRLAGARPRRVHMLLVVVALAPAGRRAATADLAPGPSHRRPAPPAPPAPVPPAPPPSPVKPPPPAPPTSPPPTAPPPATCALPGAGEPRAQGDGFEGLLPDRTLPKGFVPFAGRWAVIAEAGARPANAVLRQDQPTDPWTVALFQGEGRALADGVVRVRFRPVSGEDDQAGGIVFRAQDERNYYLVRANGLEDNLRLYVIKEGHRWQLATVTVDPPAAGRWHTLEVRVAGKTMRATLDGGPAVETADASFARGWCGLWTKSDSVTWFDDWSVLPADARPAPIPTPDPVPKPGDVLPAPHVDGSPRDAGR